MKQYLLVVCLGVATQATAVELQFERTRLGDTTYEAASVADFDGDGELDIATGEYVLKGPDFTERQKMCDVAPNGDYFDDFSDFPMDVNGDGQLDIVTGAWWGQKISWRENPGSNATWTVHDVVTVGNVERPTFYDVDGDGHLDVVPNTPGKPQRILKLVRDEDGKPTGKFLVWQISERGTGHGLGYGDINGDGRGDIVVNNGWFEGPEDPFASEWAFHEAFGLYGSASVPILVYDVNEDGKNDIIVGAGHDYGLCWWEQGEAEGAPTWTQHVIEDKRSQFHEMTLADLDNDETPELITGKRYYAHSGNDPGAEEPVGLYYYVIGKGTFERHDIDYGPADAHSGTGIYLWVTDIDGNGYKDIVAPGKEGLYLFHNLGPK